MLSRCVLLCLVAVQGLVASATQLAQHGALAVKGNVQASALPVDAEAREEKRSVCLVIATRLIFVAAINSSMPATWSHSGNWPQSFYHVLTLVARPRCSCYRSPLAARMPSCASRLCAPSQARLGSGGRSCNSVRCVFFCLPRCRDVQLFILRLRPHAKQVGE